MDTITHGLLGVTVAECGFRSRAGRAAAWMGAVAAVLPDTDMAIGLVGRLLGNPWLGWQYHRGFTHSLFAVPVMALGLALIWHRYASYKGFAFWYLCAGLALLSHPLLDWCTSYGTVLLTPLSDGRFALDAVPIIDPVYSGVLVAAILISRWLRKSRPRVNTIAIGLAGLAVSTAYLGLGYTQHERAMSRLQAHAAHSGDRILHARALPSIGTVFLWRLVYKTDGAFHFGRTNTLTGDANVVFDAAPIPDSPAIRRLADDPRIKMLDWFADGMVLPAERPTANGTVVTFQDVRYSNVAGGRNGLWGVVAVLDENGNVRSMAPFHRGLSKSADALASSSLADRLSGR